LKLATGKPGSEHRQPLTKRPMIEPEYFNLKTAAFYCGYENPRSFSKIIRDYDLPKYGPKRNMYKKSVLDEFMKSPTEFVAMKPRKRSDYSPVTV